MPTEGATNIDELEPLQPVESDGLTEANDHLQMIKQVLKNVLPGNTAAGLFDVDFTLGSAVGTGLKSLYAKFIGSSPQVAIAGFGYDMAGDTFGPYFGIEEDSPGVGTTQRIAAGTVEVKLTETRWSDANSDLACVVQGISSFTPVIGVVVPPTTNDQAQGWVQVITFLATDPITPVDVGGASVLVFDKGRV